MSARGAAAPMLSMAIVLAAVACSSGGSGDEAAATTDTTTAATPVRAAPIERADLDVIVTAPGRSDALRQDRIRAPFPARLVALRVTEGDKVAAGQVVAEVVSKNSEAARQGAEQMLAAARSPQDSADAQRAIQIARQALVRQPLRAPAAGVVLSHAAEEGDYLDEGEVFLTIAEAGAVYFNAQVTQSDLARVRAGQRARVDMPAVGAAPVGAVVHGVLPAASSQTLSAPVRLDFSPPRPDLALGLFGTAGIVVGRARNAIVVPAAAVLRDDVTGTSRVAVIDSASMAHWVVVQTGAQQGDRVAISSPPLVPGQRVIVQGQVGLPDSTRVQIRP
jgi:multidrug efflux pump subunit AcrA (membrane-fusion protein)